MSTELTAVSTFGWFSDADNELDLLTSVSTFGWYGVTLKDLIDFFNTVDFGLIIDQVNELGLEIEAQCDLGNFVITQEYQLKNLDITQTLNLRLRR